MLLFSTVLQFQLSALGIFFFTRETASITSMTIHVPAAAITGETVTLSCDYDLEGVDLYSIRWYREGEEFYRYIPREFPPSKAFPVKYINVDISKSTQNDVTLRNVRRELSGEYKCEVSADAPTFHTAILKGRMNIIEVPRDDVELIVYPSKVEIGQKIFADCYCPGSDPPANLSWYLNEQKINKKTPNVIYYPTVHKQELNSLKSSRSKIEILSNKMHFPSGVLRLRCQATILALWQKSVVDYIREDGLQTGPVVGSSQSHMGFSFDIQIRPSVKWTASLVSFNIFVSASLLKFKIIFS